MSLEDCADILRQQDPDRFMAVLAAPVPARPKLLPIYALNAEIARAAWISPEPMICQMRLRWWADQVRQIGQTGASIDHRVLTPLAAAIDDEIAEILDGVIAARHWDVAKQPFADIETFQQHLEQTGGALTWAAAQSLGAQTDEQAIREVGYASALANWFMAVPDLQARGCVPLVDDRAPAIKALALDGLERLKRARKHVPPVARPATRTGWRAAKTLRLAGANPAAVASGRLHSSEFFRRASLLIRVLGNSV